jgi:hypothetical protein
VIWIYGICDRRDAPEGRGLAEAPLDAVRGGDLLAVVSRHARRPTDPALDALRLHEQVIENLMADGPVLPMRFGTTLTDDDALREILAARQSEFLATLDRVRDRVELGIRAMRPPDTAAPDATAPRDAMSGRAYLEAKLRSGRSAEQEAAAVHEPLARLAFAATRHAVSRPGEVLRASYLVDRPAVTRFRRTVERLQSERPEAAILCTGPWPPYSFVAAPADDPLAA